MKSTEPAYLQYLFAKAKDKGRPISGTFEITSRCNFNCRMCYIHRSNCEEVRRRELTTEEWKRIADELYDSGVLMLLITGGEPLIREDFRDIYIYAKEKGFSVSVNTNGSLINDEIVELFKEYPPARVSVSMYGVSPETYERVTGSAAGYEKATAGALALKKAGVQIRLSMSITPFNKDDIPAIFDWARDNEFPIQATSYMFPPARIGDTIERCDPETAAANLVACEKARYPIEEYLRRAREIVNGKRPEDPFGEETDDIGERIRCRAGQSTFWITYEGEMTPCAMMPDPKISLRENSVEKAWEYIFRQSQEIILPPKCTKCAYRYICDACAASCRAETGSFAGVPEYQCRKAKEFYRLTKEALG